MKLKTITASTAAALAGAALVALPATTAQASDDEIRRTGNCTGATDWKLKAKPDDGRLEVEFEIDSNRNGQKWNWNLRRNGKVFASGTRTTAPPSGSFSVERRTANGPGKDTIGVRARNPRSGEVCRGSLSI